MTEPFDNDESGFMESLGGIRKLKQDRVDLLQQTPRKKPIVRRPVATGDSSASQAADGDRIVHPVPASWYHHGIQQKLQRKIRLGQIAIEARLDLHGCRQVDARRELENFLQHALHDDARMLLIIHGKGFRSESQAVLRPLVRQWLRQHSMVLAYCPAQPRDGGDGASYVYLKKG